jgi:poly(A) polymerase
MLRFMQGLFSKCKQPVPEPEYITDHGIDQSHISIHAIKVINRLVDAGFSAYLVGGAVRDTLLGLHPKDFDVATDAHPEQVKALFNNSLLIGRRFKLVHVRFGREIIEVATFRSDSATTKGDKHRIGRKGMLLRDNHYGKIHEDIWRRDFTVNALYYDLQRDCVLDYCGGFADLAAKRIRVIGDPQVRYREDPVRMIRALRYAAKLGFTLDHETAKHIQAQDAGFDEVSPDRVFVEIVKTFYGGFALQAYDKLDEYGFLSVLMPQVTAVLSGKAKGYRYGMDLIQAALYNTDKRYHSRKPLSTAYLFVVLLWPVVQHHLYKAGKAPGSFMDKLRQAIDATLSAHRGPVSLPKAIAETCEAIWLLQYQLVYREQERIVDVTTHPKFRMGYDFLLLRAQAGEDIYMLANWWHDYTQASEVQQAEMVTAYTEKTQRMRAKHGRDKRDNKRHRRPARKPSA